MARLSHLMKLDSKNVLLAGLSFVSGFFFCAIVLSSSTHTTPRHKVLIEGPAAVSADPFLKARASVQLLAEFGSQQPATFSTSLQVVQPPEAQLWDMSSKPVRNTDLIDFRVRNEGF